MSIAERCRHGIQSERLDHRVQNRTRFNFTRETKTENRKQKTENRKQKTENRSQEAGDIQKGNEMHREKPLTA
jgi:hypothetical protein